MKCSTNVFIYVNEKFKASFSSLGCFAIFSAPPLVQLRVPIGWPIMAGDGSSSCPLFSPPYRSRRVLQLRLSCQVAGGGGVLNGELVGDRTMSHIPSHWDSLVDLLHRFNYSADLAHNNGQQLG